MSTIAGFARKTDDGLWKNDVIKRGPRRGTPIQRHVVSGRIRELKEPDLPPDLLGYFDAFMHPLKDNTSLRRFDEALMDLRDLDEAKHRQLATAMGLTEITQKRVAWRKSDDGFSGAFGDVLDAIRTVRCVESGMAMRAIGGEKPESSPTMLAARQILRDGTGSRQTIWEEQNRQQRLEEAKRIAASAGKESHELSESEFLALMPRENLGRIANTEIGGAAHQAQTKYGRFMHRTAVEEAVRQGKISRPGKWAASINPQDVAVTYGLPKDFYVDGRTVDNGSLRGEVHINPRYDPDATVDRAMQAMQRAAQAGYLSGERRRWHDEQIRQSLAQAAQVAQAAMADQTSHQ